MIKREGEARGFCPYYYTFQVKQKVDFIFMPYNYILDVDRLDNYEDIIKNSVIIYNVVEAAPTKSTPRASPTLRRNQRAVRRIIYVSWTEGSGLRVHFQP
jgi:hypothetical protein